MSPASVQIRGSSYRSLIGLLIPRMVFLNEPPQLVHFQQKFLRMCVQRSRLTTKLAMYRCAQDFRLTSAGGANLLEGTALGQCHQTVLEAA